MTDYADLEKRLRERAEMYLATDALSVMNTRDILREAVAALASLTKERDEARASKATMLSLADALNSARGAIAELVRIKDRKEAEGPYSGYDREKNAAWNAARAVLSRHHAPQEPPSPD